MRRWACFFSMMMVVCEVFSGEADWRDGRWSLSDVGPFMSCTLNIEKSRIVTSINVKVGDAAKGATGGVAFDSTACGVRAGWTGGFLTFSPARYGVIEHPRPNGVPAFSLLDGAIWSKDATYKGLTRHAQNLVFHYSVGGTAVSESNGLMGTAESAVFVRRFQVAAHAEELTVRLALAGESAPRFVTLDETFAQIAEKEGSVSLRLLPSAETRVIRVLCGKGDSSAWIGNAKKEIGGLPALETISGAGGRIFRDEPEVKGVIGGTVGGLAFDDIPAPHKNDAKALLFLTGVDFLPNGDIAVCSLHGDVWIVKGVDANLGKIVWNRFATGLFQPLGLRVVNGQIHVLGRDQITRLEDANKDGEADHYHSFFRNPSISAGAHDYTACLETDSQGRFYYVCPKGVHRVSADGTQHEIIAKGWRNPVSMGVGPKDIITVSPQEGNWTPASMICMVKPDGYYGYPGPQVTANRPLGYDAPWCWLPRATDNSTGGQTWLSGAAWGPLQGRMVNLSYGQCAMQWVQADETGNVSIVPVNHRFASGICRGRISPHDGALYVVGTMGWQTNANLDGCLQRVRRAEGPLLVPIATKTFKDGVVLEFETPLDRADAEDAGAYAVEAWGYKYSKNYGSPEFKVSQADVKGRDEWTVSKAVLSTDGRALFLKVDELQVVQQMQVKYRVKSAAGERLSGEVIFTIHAVPTRGFLK